MRSLLAGAGGDDGLPQVAGGREQSFVATMIAATGHERGKIVARGALRLRCCRLEEMTWKLLPGAFVVCAALACACEEPSTSARTLVIRGKVTTGAHSHTPLAGGYVGVLGPQGRNGGHWIRYVSSSSSGLPRETTTSPDGSYSYTVEVAAVATSEDGFPFFIAVSDAAQTLTMLSEIPGDLVTEGAELTIDINPTTTAASQMICPGGTSPPPANTWCYADPKTASVGNTGLIGILDGALSGNLSSLETGSPPTWGAFASGFLNDPATFTEIKTNLAGQGITVGAATPAGIASSIAALPLVHPSKASATPPSTGGDCKLVWDCGASTQCATVYGARTGSASQPDAATCASTCKSQGACTCQGC